MFRSIRWRIVFSFVLLVVLAMAGLSIYLSNRLRDAYVDNIRNQLLKETRLLREVARSLLAQGGTGEALDALAKHYGDLLEARVTVIGADGVVLGESDEDRTQMDNHLRRPEVQQALAQGQGSSIRYSRTVGYEMLYLALPVRDGDRVLGIVRVSLPLNQVEAGVATLRWMIFWATLLSIVVASLVALLVAQRTVRPIRQLTGVADRMAAGDLDARLFPSTRDEVGRLTGAFNRMADHLQDQVATLARERSRLAAILAHMADGVLITDDLGQVLLVNPAATALLQIHEEEALGRTFAQVVRHHRFIELWKRCQEEGEEQVEAVEIDRGGLFLQMIVTPFHEAARQGFLIILQDLTRIRRLETVRRDFISNVSHELRTPLASLKALVDTLREGALEDPPAARRFLDRVEVEVDALTQMVRELLELSRVESNQAPLERKRVAVGELLAPPVGRLRAQAERAGLQLRLDLPPDDVPYVLADAERIQQVVTNLVHNAIKFTPPGGEVAVQGSVEGEEVVIAVHDTGVGISAEDLPRIFERFYKADRARSGQGTGLGLAIAKHIVQAHGGRIWADSIEGQGSSFYFSLPIESGG